MYTLYKSSFYWTRCSSFHNISLSIISAISFFSKILRSFFCHNIRATVVTVHVSSHTRWEVYENIKMNNVQQEHKILHSLFPIFISFFRFGSFFSLSTDWDIRLSAFNVIRKLCSHFDGIRIEHKRNGIPIPFFVWSYMICLSALNTQPGAAAIGDHKDIFFTFLYCQIGNFQSELKYKE